MNQTPRWRTVRTQAELDKVIAAGDYAAVVGSATVTAYDSATVRASDSATVTAYDSATVTASGSATVTAYGSATVRASGSATVTAYDSATVRASGSATVTASGSATVTAYDSATVRASDSATVRAYDSATVTASSYVAVHRLSMRSNVSGGVIIEPPDLTATAAWLDYYGIKPARGFVVLYKGVDAQFTSAYRTRYAPGDKPIAPDWDGGKNACGGGLHFSPRPELTRRYCDPERFVAVKVKVADIAPIGTAVASDKVKARACTVLYECDENGVEIRAAAAAS